MSVGGLHVTAAGAARDDLETLASQNNNRSRTFQTAQQGDHKLVEHAERVRGLLDCRVVERQGDRALVNGTDHTAASHPED
jgi:hypothetical protein